MACFHRGTVNSLKLKNRVKNLSTFKKALLTYITINKLGALKDL